MNTMTQNPLSFYFGKSGQIAIFGIVIKVAIVDARTTSGRRSYLVTPISGSGSVWVSSDRVELGVEWT